MSVVTRFFRAIWWIFSRLWAPLMALGWPALIVYGAVLPRAGDIEAIRESGGAVPLLIGVAGGISDCRDTEPCITSAAQRSYLAFPSALSSAAVTVVEDAPQGVVVSTERGAAILVIVVWLICFYGTWFYWIRPRVMASNTSLERTRRG